MNFSFVIVLLTGTALYAQQIEITSLKRQKEIFYSKPENKDKRNIFLSGFFPTFKYYDTSNVGTFWSDSTKKLLSIENTFKGSKIQLSPRSVSASSKIYSLSRDFQINIYGTIEDQVADTSSSLNLGISDLHSEKRLQKILSDGSIMNLEVIIPFYYNGCPNCRLPFEIAFLPRVNGGFEKTKIDEYLLKAEMFYYSFDASFRATIYDILVGSFKPVGFGGTKMFNQRVGLSNDEIYNSAITWDVGLRLSKFNILYADGYSMRKAIRGKFPAIVKIEYNL